MLFLIEAMLAAFASYSIYKNVGKAEGVTIGIFLLLLVLFQNLIIFVELKERRRKEEKIAK